MNSPLLLPHPPLLLLLLLLLSLLTSINCVNTDPEEFEVTVKYTDRSLEENDHTYSYSYDGYSDTNKTRTSLCLPGEIIIPGSTLLPGYACELCPAPFKIALSDKSECTSCPSGQITEDGISCFGCVSGKFLSSSSCLVCPKGRYSESGQVECTGCEAGKYLSDDGTNPDNAYLHDIGEIGSCGTCEEGSWSEEGAGECKECVAGKFIDGAGTSESSCQICTSGSYSNFGSTTCTLCPAGTYLSDDGTNPDNSFRHDNVEDCVVCEGGRWSEEEASVCTECEAGKAYSGAGTSINDCATCSNGSYATSGSTTCTGCAFGKYFPSAGTSSASCITCTSGTYADGSGGGDGGDGIYEEPCPCADGYFCNHVGSGSCDVCEKYLSAESCDYVASEDYGEAGGDEAGARECKEVCFGVYANAGEPSCTDCEAGKYLEDNAVEAEAHDNESKCITCVGGSWSLAGSAVCTECVAGKSYSGAGTSISDCATCADGSYATAGSAACTGCALGKYFASTGTSEDSCVICSSGTYTSSTSSTSCTDCSAGKYLKDDGSVSDDEAGSDDCVDDTAALQAVFTHLGYLDGTCSDEEYRLFCTDDSILVWSGVAAPGWFAATCRATCDNRCVNLHDSESRCISCPGGSWSSAGAAECTECEAGKAQCTQDDDSWTGCIGGASIENCATCDDGFWSEAGVAHCTGCELGKYFGGAGTSEASCVNCASGKYAGLGSAVCGCEDGTNFCNYDGDPGHCEPCADFESEIDCIRGGLPAAGTQDCRARCFGTVGSASCSDCDAGKYLADEGGSASAHDAASKCIECASGQYSAAASAKCQECDAGKNLLEAETGDESWACTTCVSGTHSGSSAAACTACQAGTYLEDAAVSPEGHDSIDDCLVCASGKYAGVGSASCTDCDAGKFLEDDGSILLNANLHDSESRCTTCAGGSWSLDGSAECTGCEAGKFYNGAGKSIGNCTMCANGYWSGSGSTACTGCVTGKYLAGAGTSESSCAVCASGTYAEVVGSTSCTDCGAGKYLQDDGSIVGNANLHDSESRCTTCAGGSWSLAGSAKCTECSAGKFYDGAGTSSADCASCAEVRSGPPTCCDEDGDCEDGSDAWCCDGGYFYCSNNEREFEGYDGYAEYMGGIICPSNFMEVGCRGGGYWSSAGSTACTGCEVGKFLNGTGTSSDSCNVCAGGHYASNTGSAKCTQCESDMYLTDDGSNPHHAYLHDSVVRCLECPSSTWSNHGSAFCGSYEDHHDDDGGGDDHDEACDDAFPCGADDYFCNYDSGDSGACQSCSYHEDESSCEGVGLPEAGVQDCKDVCFG
ncbi:hypothetical protein TrLO_g3583 [Triparma laevis f. longispina]|uniref:Tyrosine-protein kinase ephrin type A/B receptor-like domain-containing protein n=1 Tax=Triparma laevis f. longispina TaxID=1714387 RepID=A0A9W6ZEX5_9STRA|nr:hypothetical protein TrLO_g3583 [Triparma laevis f. longispina]